MNMKLLNFKFSRRIFVQGLMCAAMPFNAYAAQTNTNADNFKIKPKARSGSFYYDTSVNFSAYNKILLFPTTYNEWKISEASKAPLRKSWQEMDETQLKNIAGVLDDILKSRLEKSKRFNLTDQPEENALAIQFRLKEFSPNVIYQTESHGTVGQSFKLTGLGNLYLQAVVVDAKTKKLVVLIDTIDSINSGKFTGATNRSNFNHAWRLSFKRMVDNVLGDMKKAK